MLRKLILLSVLTLLLASRAQAQVVPAIQKSEHMKLASPGKMPGVIASNGQEIPNWDAYLKTPDPVYSNWPSTAPANQRTLEISQPKTVSQNNKAIQGNHYPVLAQGSGAIPVPGQPVPVPGHPAPVAAHPAPVHVPGVNPGPIYCDTKAGCRPRCDWRRIWEWMTFCAPRNGYLCGGCHTCAPSCTPPLYMYFLPCHSGCRPQCGPRPPLDCAPSGHPNCANCVR